jgi:hypothetical protein
VKRASTRRQRAVGPPPDRTAVGWGISGRPRSRHAFFREKGDRPFQSLGERYGRLPAQQFPRLGNVGLALSRVVRGQGARHDARAGIGHVDHHFRQLPNGEFPGIAQIDRPGHAIRGGHQPDEAFDQIVDEAERPGLVAVAVDRYRFVAQGLHDEVGHDPAVMGMHARPIGVEDAGDPDIEVVLTVIVEEQRFGAALAFVVAGARPDRVDIAPVSLRLGMDAGIAVDFAGRGLKNPRFHPLGQTQHVDGAMHAGLDRLDRIELIVDRRGWTGKIEDLVHFDIKRKGDVVAHHLEMRVIEEMGDIFSGTGEIVIDAQDLVTVGKQPFAQERSEESRPAGNQNPFASVHFTPPIADNVPISRELA